MINPWTVTAAVLVGLPIAVYALSNRIKIPLGKKVLGHHLSCKHGCEKHVRSCAGIERWYAALDFQHLFTMSHRVSGIHWDQIDTEALGRALEAVIKRHPILAMCVAYPTHESCNGNPGFVPVPNPMRRRLPVKIEAKSQDWTVEREMQTQMNNLFDDSGWLWRLLVVKDKDGDNVMVATFHHIITDGLGGAQFLSDVMEHVEFQYQKEAGRPNKSTLRSRARVAKAGSTNTSAAERDIVPAAQAVLDMRPTLATLGTLVLKDQFPDKSESNTDIDDSFYYGKPVVNAEGRAPNVNGRMEFRDIPANPLVNACREWRRSSGHHVTVHSALLAACHFAFFRVVSERTGRMNVGVSSNYPVSLRADKEQTCNLDDRLGVFICAVQCKEEITLEQSFWDLAFKLNREYHEKRQFSKGVIGLIAMLPKLTQLTKLQREEDEPFKHWERRLAFTLSNLGRLSTASGLGSSLRFTFNAQPMGQGLFAVTSWGTEEVDGDGTIGFGVNTVEGMVSPEELTLFCDTFRLVLQLASESNRDFKASAAFLEGK